MNLNDLINQYQQAKEKELAAIAKRRELEKKTCIMVGQKDEGSIHAETDKYKVTVAYRMNRRLDAEALESVRQKMPLAIYNKVVRYKPDLNLKEYRYLVNNEPKLASLLNDAITSKEGAPTITIKKTGV